MKPLFCTGQEGLRPAQPHPAARAFTARELLVVLAVSALLLCVHLSALSNTAYQSKVAQCGANLKQYISAVQAFSMDRNNVLPGNTGGGGSGFWPWDTAASTDNILITNYGLTRPGFYCPSFPQQNIDQLWNFTGGFNATRVTGYATALPPNGGSRILSDDVDLALTTQHYTLNGSDPSLGPAGATVQIPPSQRMLLADAILSAPGQNDPSQAPTYQWTMQTQALPPIGTLTPYGPWKGYNTPHMGSVTPTGGNIAMLDGHVEWRPFTNMLPRTETNSDVFWW